MDPDTRRALKHAVQQPSTRERLKTLARKARARLEALEAREAVKEVEEVSSTPPGRSDSGERGGDP